MFAMLLAGGVLPNGLGGDRFMAFRSPIQCRGSVSSYFEWQVRVVGWIDLFQAPSILTNRKVKGVSYPCSQALLARLPGRSALLRFQPTIDPSA
jgi:hypothetical protein